MSHFNDGLFLDAAAANSHPYGEFPKIPRWLLCTCVASAFIIPAYLVTGFVNAGSCDLVKANLTNCLSHLLNALMGLDCQSR